MSKRYTHHQDPGHGWLEVPRAELDVLGLLPKISAYSYQNGEQVFLEEDRDMALFGDAKGWVKYAEFKPLARQVRAVLCAESPIRGYDTFKLTPSELAMKTILESREQEREFAILESRNQLRIKHFTETGQRCVAPDDAPDDPEQAPAPGA